MDMADKHAKGNLLSALEGGYNLTALPLCIGEDLQVLTQHPGHS